MQRMYEMSVASSVAISSLRSVVNFWPTEMKPCGSSGEMRWEEPELERRGAVAMAGDHGRSGVRSPTFLAGAAGCSSGAVKRCFTSGQPTPSASHPE